VVGLVLSRSAGESNAILEAGGYFCATEGAVDEEAIRKYIENQKWDEDEHGFKITAPTEP
jgi:REP element-mobilizing transposase RayT